MLWAQSTTKDLHQGLTQTYSISKLFISQVNIAQVMFLFLFFSLFIFHGHSTREPASSRATYFILRAYTGTGASHSQHKKKSGEVLEKKAGEWTGRVEISREEILAVSVACMAIYWPTLGFKGRTFKLRVLTRWDFNFCVRSSPLRATRQKSKGKETGCVTEVYIPSLQEHCWVSPTP